MRKGCVGCLVGLIALGLVACSCLGVGMATDILAQAGECLIVAGIFAFLVCVTMFLRFMGVDLETD